MKYKYNIQHKLKTKSKIINFKNKDGMIKYLNKNKDELNRLNSVMLNFSTIALPLKQTAWHVKQLTDKQQQRLDDKKKLNDFINKLER